MKYPQFWSIVAIPLHIQVVDILAEFSKGRLKFVDFSSKSIFWSCPLFHGTPSISFKQLCLARTESIYPLGLKCIKDWISDGQCDDINNHNNNNCSYDGGDCCGSNAVNKYCFNCRCLSNIDEIVFTLLLAHFDTFSFSIFI